MHVHTRQCINKTLYQQKHNIRNGRIVVFLLFRRTKKSAERTRSEHYRGITELTFPPNWQPPNPDQLIKS